MENVCADVNTIEEKRIRKQHEVARNPCPELCRGGTTAAKKNNINSQEFIFRSYFRGRAKWMPLSFLEQERRVSLRRHPRHTRPLSTPVGGVVTQSFPVFLPQGNHFHLRSAATTPHDRVERDLSNKLFPRPLCSILFVLLLRGLCSFFLLAEHVPQTASTTKKNTQGGEISRTVDQFHRDVKQTIYLSVLLSSSLTLLNKSLPTV